MTKMSVGYRLKSIAKSMPVKDSKFIGKTLDEAAGKAPLKTYDPWPVKVEKPTFGDPKIDARVGKCAANGATKFFECMA